VEEHEGEHLVSFTNVNCLIPKSYDKIMLHLLFRLVNVGHIRLLIKATDNMTKHILCSQREDNGNVSDINSKKAELLDAPFKQVCK
jgi:hypothetical protein